MYLAHIQHVSSMYLAVFGCSNVVILILSFVFSSVQCSVAVVALMEGRKEGEEDTEQNTTINIQGTVHNHASTPKSSFACSLISS